MTPQSPLPNTHFKSNNSIGLSRAAVSTRFILLLLATIGIGTSARPVVAQTGQPNVPVRNEDGSVFVNNNARQIRTGPLSNGSRTPLPTLLPADTFEGEAIDVDFTRQAPNSIEIRPNVPYIEDAFNQLIDGTQGPDVSYDLQEDSIQITTTFELNRIVGQHGYAEGIQVTVIDADGNRGESDTVFVRGGRVTRGPGGARLPESNSVSVTYGANDVVELRVLNIRNNRAEPTESAIYFTDDFSDNDRIGEFVVEDLEEGGDLDFNDGEYVQAPTGEGGAVTRREIRNLEVTTETERIELPPFVDQNTTVRQILVEGEVETSVEEREVARTRGQVEITDQIAANLSSHARGIRTQNDEQLVYSRYTSLLEARLGSDGLGVTGQLRPLFKNPNVPPTLLTGNLRFDPFAGNNRASLTSTFGFTQYLTRTHRPAADVFGNQLVLAGAEDTDLLVPTGLFSNRQRVGYVPAIAPTQAPLASVDGIFAPPAGQDIVIAPPDPQRVGRGESAYTDNVGGLLIERTDGQLSFIPQWTKDGYAQSSITLDADEVSQIIYALVPQQPGQDLQLDQTYAVTAGSGEYTIDDGGFRIISADLQPQNFVLETAEIYAVEDTIPAANAATEEFNGIQGIYAEVAGGEPVPTVDVAIAAEADARLGSTLLTTGVSPVSPAVAAGQPGYVRTTRAGGFYIGGSLTAGLGNQEDTVTTSQITTTRVVDQLFEERTIQTFSSARSREDTIRTESGTIEQNTGEATFEINGAGELSNVEFIPGEETTTITLDDEVTREVGEIETGAQTLIDTEVILDDTPISEEVRETVEEQESTTARESYPNFSSVLGELTVGGLFSFGNTPWTAAANTVRAEVFYRDTVFGQGGGGSDLGVRGEVVFHPFGEVMRDASQVDTTGTVVPVYQTELALDAGGNPIVEQVTGENGESVAVPVSQFVLDESGEPIVERVGTGRARGPGAYLRVENVFNNDGGAEIAGGIQLTF